MGIKSFKEFNEELTVEDRFIIESILGKGTLNENFSFNKILNRIEDYSKKGLLNKVIIESILNNQYLNNNQTLEIKNTIQKKRL